MKSFNQFINEEKSDIETKYQFSKVSDSSGNARMQAQHDGMTIAKDSHSPNEYTSYHIHVHSNPKNEYVSHSKKSEAHITHYHYKTKPSYITDAKHQKIKSEGQYVVKTPDSYGIYDRSTEVHHKTLNSALKAAKKSALEVLNRKNQAALGAAATHSYRNFSQRGNLK